MKRLSESQTNYAKAKAIYEIASTATKAYDKVMDAEGERLGLEGPYCILPEGHQLWAKAQELLDTENEAREFMRTAAYLLFDWATETALALRGTATQKAEIRSAVAKVKTMAHVEAHFEELVSISMRLAS